MDATTDLSFAATLTVTLWANAIAAMKREDRTAADQLCTVVAVCRKELNESLQIVLGEELERSMNPQLAEYWQVLSLYDAVLGWARESTDRESPRCVHLPVSGRRAVEVESSNRRYYGLHPRDRDPLVVVEERDGSRRLLPEIENEIELGIDIQWGYGGGGPSALGEALVNDAFNDSMLCPDCFGATPLTAWTILCGHCRNTGYGFDLESLTFRLVSGTIEGLPSSRDEPKLAGKVEWTLTQQDVLDSALGNVNVRS